MVQVLIMRLDDHEQRRHKIKYSESVRHVGNEQLGKSRNLMRNYRDID